LPELRRRITYLMLFRVVLITLVLALTFALTLGDPQEVRLPGTIVLFGIVITTYSLTIVYALYLRRVKNPIRFADAQLAADLAITTVLVHVTGGAQSGYTFLYPLSIVGAATVRYRRGAIVVAGASIGLFIGVALLGWLQLLPTPAGQRLVPWDLSKIALVRQLALNVGACTAIAFLASNLGDELARSGERLERQVERAADLSVLNANIIRCLASGLVTVDKAGIVMTLNEAAGEILAGAKVVGRPIRDVLPELVPVLDRLPQDDELRRAEIATAGGKVLGVSISPLTNHVGEAIGRILNFQELTELRRMEAQVKRAEQLAVIGGVAAGVAHEIRNPLAAISGSIELLRSVPQVGAENQALMDIVVREVDRLNALITDLLEYARPRPPVLMDMDLGEALGETVRVFAQDKRTHEVKITYAPPDDAVRVNADPAQIRQVAWNLLRNAAEAMPDGGAIKIRVAREEGTGALLISDEGSGIAPEDLERIFEPFFTTKSGGSGLGLATVYRIITQHNGTVAIDSKLGTGTTVTVRLPAP
jgi:two-component system sensor histidine kinase PilS (NtrC family)